MKVSMCGFLLYMRKDFIVLEANVFNFIVVILVFTFIRPLESSRML